MMPAENRSSALTLTAEREDGHRTTYHLAAGRSVLVGTSKDCGLRLEGQRLSPCHCLISSEEGQLWVQDWASTSGTLVNGNRIEAKVRVNADDRLEVGEYRICAALSSSPSTAFSPPPMLVSQADGEAEAARDARDEAQVAEEVALWAQDELLAASDAPIEPYAVATWERDSFEQETIALLREEVDSLQGLLAERDAQLSELTAATADSAANRNVENDDEEATALLARMETLLAEAAHGDERVVLLEEMLRTAEEANQAEQEERRQLEAWVGDIERRIIQRDDLRNAETEALRERLEAAIAERDRVQRQLQEAASLGDAAKRYEETLDRLQQQNKSLQEQLAEMAAERATLAKQLESSSHRHDEAMREERAAIAQERAIVSRLRCELANKVADLESAPRSSSKAADEAATRLQALREHLREIHNEEQHEHREHDNGSLTGRISRLWKRLDS